MLRDSALACAVLRSRAAHPGVGETLGGADWFSGQPEGPGTGVSTGQGTKLGDPRPAPVCALRGEYCPMLRASC